ncbi:helix-turn-helix domain-containing protein [Streptomyces sp. NPDC006879]|uniref:helix-turn-helix domain-containing protein n=1 Tax=Streptomyces sp. NPDC006879 TaxID=3364767 RepID=UPI0036C9B661
MTETWRYCGDQIKLWRTEAGVSREDLAEESGYSYESVKSVEQGRRRPTRALLEAADSLCGAKGKLLAAAQYLKPEPFPARSQEFMTAEAEAIAIQWYEPLLIPGLLQTEAYASALVSGDCPPLDDETIEERVRARLARQSVMDRRISTLYSFVVHENALRSLVGGSAVMESQLLHLLDMGSRRNISVQVLRVGECSGVALRGPLVLLETPEHQHWAWAEGQETSAMYSSPDKVSTLTQAHAMIRMHALNKADSAEFIRKIVEGQ